MFEGGANVEVESNQMSNEQHQHMNLSTENDIKTNTENECSTQADSQSFDRESQSTNFLESGPAENLRLLPFQPRNIDFPSK